MQLGLVIVWLPLSRHGINLCSPLKCSLGIHWWDIPILTLQKKVSFVTPAQDAAITPRQGEVCASLRSLFPLAPAVLCSHRLTWRSLFFSWTGSVSWCSPNKMTSCFKILSLEFSSSFRKLEDLFFSLICISENLTSFSVKCKTKHYDIFLPSVGCRSNFFQTFFYF